MDWLNLLTEGEYETLGIALLLLALVLLLLLHGWEMMEKEDDREVDDGSE